MGAPWMKKYLGWGLLLKAAQGARVSRVGGGGFLN